FIVDLVGTAGPQTLDVGDPAMTMSWPSFMGPNGGEIMFRGRTSVAAGRRAGIFAFDPATKHLRPLTPTDGETDAFYQAPVTSDDGRYLTYTDWSPELQRNSIHLVDLRTGDDRVLDDGTTRDQGYAGFSPDGRYLAFTSYDGQLGSVWLEAVDGSSPAHQVGPAYAPSDTGYLFSRFSPDAKSLLVVNEPTKESRLVDVETGGQGRVIDWTPGDTRAWQRLAP